MLGRSDPSALWLGLGLLAAGLLLAACGTSTAAKPEAATRPAVPTEAPSAPPPPTATAQPQEVLLILAQEDGDPVAGALDAGLARLAGESGLAFSSQPALDLGQLPANLIALITYRGDTNLFDSIGSAGVDPARTVAIAPQASIEAEGVTVIGPDGLRRDRSAFLAGYAAAVLSDNYRVAVVSAEGVSPSGSATAFLNGARYYCGLCRAAYPPFADYPASVRLAGTPDDGDVAAALQQLEELEVGTVYLAPGLENGLLPGALAEGGIQMLGQKRPDGIPQEAWIASIRPAPELALQDLWADVSRGASSGSVPIPIAVTERNRDRFSDARYRLVEEVIRDLVAGYIATGVKTP